MTQPGRDFPSHNYGQTLENQERAAFARARRRKIIGVLVVLVIALVGVSAVGIIEKWQTRQARQMAGSAANLFASGRQREAMLRIQTAWSMRPDEPQVMRALAGIFDATGDPQSLSIHAKLVAVEGASEDDRQRCVLAALRFGKYDLAANEARILAASGDEGFKHAVQAAQSRAQGDIATAERELRAVDADSAAYDTSLLQLASLLSSRGGNAPEAQAEAFSILEGLSVRPDRAGLEALATGMSSRLVSAEKKAAWLARLESHPLANDRTFLLLQSERWPTDEAERREIVNLVMARFAGAPVERKVPAMLWLNEHEEFPRTLELMSAAKARTNADAFVLWLDATAGRGDWTAIDAALSKQGPLTGAFVELFRARAAQNTGRAGTAQQKYEHAIELALSDPAQMPAVLAFLETDGQKVLLVAALEKALDNPAQGRTARDSLLRISAKGRDAAELRDAWSAISRAQPDDMEATNAADYYGLVLGTASPAEVLTRTQASRSDVDTCAVRALALLKQAKNKEAAAVFRGMSIVSNRITPQQKAVVVTVLAANGRPDQAELMGATLDAALLTAQEVEMVEKSLGR